MPEQEQDDFVGLPPFKAEVGANVVKMSDLAAELHLDLPLVKAEDLAETEEPFIIRNAKGWIGKKDATVYFCECVHPDTGEEFAVNLGGQAVVEKLEKFFASGPKAPVEVHLVKHSGGHFGRYYTLE